MKEIIAIVENDGKQGVDARELHGFLKVGKVFGTWITDRIKKYDFKDGMDFFPVLGKTNGRPKIDYIISLDMAKELSMLERNAQGKKARLYFIECERELRGMSSRLDDGEGEFAPMSLPDWLRSLGVNLTRDNDKAFALLKSAWVARKSLGHKKEELNDEGYILFSDEVLELAIGVQNSSKNNSLKVH